MKIPWKVSLARVLNPLSMVEPIILQDSKVLEPGHGANGRLSIISEKGKGSKGTGVPLVLSGL